MKTITIDDKKIDEIKEEFIKEFVNNHNPDEWRWLRGIYIEDIWDFFLPHLKSNDEIKREAVEGFDAELMSLAISNIMNEEDAFGNIKKRWNDSTWEILLALQSAFLMYRSLTQKENNE